MFPLVVDRILLFLYSLLFFLTPLVVFPLTSELFEFNKIIFIYLITTLILFFWILKMILLRKIILKKTPFDIFFLLFLIGQLISTFFSIDRHTSIFGYYGRFNGGLFSLLTYLTLYYGVVSNFSKDQIEKILKLSVLTSILTVFIGLPGKLNHDFLCLVFTGEWSNNCWSEQFKPAERMFSTLGQPNWLGAYLSINFFIALYFYYKDNKAFLKNLTFLLANGVIFNGILFSGSRSAILSTIFLLVVGLILLSVFKFLFEGVNYKKIIAVFFLIFSLTFIFKTGINQIDRYLKLSRTQKLNQTKPDSHILVTESIDIRKIVWKGAIELWRKYPWFGSGVETFGYSYYLTRPREHNLTSEWDYLYNKAHNEYLNYLATTGVMGLGTYLLMIGAILLFSSKILVNQLKEPKIRDGFLLNFFLLLGYLTILLTNFFGFSTTTINLFFYLTPAIIVLLSYKKEEHRKERVELINPKKIFFVLITTLFFLFLVIKTINYWRADLYYAKAEKYSKLGHYQQAANYLYKAFRLKYEHVYEDRLSYYLAVLALLAADQNEKQIAKKLISSSSFFNEKSLQASPKNILYLKTKAKNHYLYYQVLLDKKLLEKGIDALSRAYQYAPTEPKIPYTTAVFYNLLLENTKDKEEGKKLTAKALDFLNQAIDLKPNYREPLFSKAQLLKKMSKNDEARKVLKIILEKINPQDEEVKKELESLK